MNYSQILPATKVLSWLFDEKEKARQEYIESLHQCRAKCLEYHELKNAYEKQVVSVGDEYRRLKMIEQ